jgi:hypothetical protein
VKERSVEQHFCRCVIEAGYQHFKVGYDGWPDRQVLTGANAHFWVELKAPDGRLRANQKARIAELRRRGDIVLVLDSTEAMPLLISQAAMSAILRQPLPSFMAPFATRTE